MTYFTVCAARGEEVIGASGRAETEPVAGPSLTKAENPVLEEPSPDGNPLSRIPMESLFVTRERPVFSASRRPPPPPLPPPTPTAGSSPRAELERPPLTLQGTVIREPQDIALVLDEVAKTSIRLHVGEEAEGWRLRAVDHRTLTLEKDSRIVVISFPEPASSPSSRATLEFNRPSDGKLRTKSRGKWISMAPELY